MTLVNITIDGKEVSVEEGTNIIEAAKTIGIEIPHYCYHPGLRPDGNCRMCLVQMEKAPKPVIACRTTAAQGQVFHASTPEVKKMRQNVMEFLLINHPLDCPTCDQAGECRLQDYYMQYDLIPSRYEEAKVHKDKMVDLGSGVMLDEERCVVCTRCVRFCQEIPKKEELYVQERGNHSMVATFPGKKMTNAYAGCTIDVCPVGALTSKDFRFKKRVWFLKETPSVCPGCSRGCNINIHQADDKVYRLKPRFNPSVNKYWMCDEGRYDYPFLNVNRRMKAAYKAGTDLIETSNAEVLDHLERKIATYKNHEIGFIASARESNEAIDAFCDFAEKTFTADQVYFSKNDPQNPSHDDVLITADKNPNSAHIRKRALKAVNTIPAEIKAVIVQRDLSLSDIKFLHDKKITILALFATNLTEADSFCETILPLPTYAEQTGHFTNCDGLEQSFAKAFEPKGESHEISFYLGELARKLGDVKRAG